MPIKSYEVHSGGEKSKLLEEIQEVTRRPEGDVVPLNCIPQGENKTLVKLDALGYIRENLY